ncbi:MAG TPA: hypothetical protein VL463_29015 [Kofleriaceae bacterium]|nr:hypothetical protein [Kofleriaceae bacterium]
MILAIVIGALAGLHTSTWGMYKDAAHEGFTWPKYFRSTIVGAVLGGVANQVLDWDLDDPGARFVYWGLIYCLERACTEFWKYFIREEDQSKYFIPMQFGIMGVPMKDAKKRITIGVIVACACVGVFYGIRALEARYAGVWPRWLVVVTVGSFFGWISAFGGAWKDAPVEGFETFKFFRSPAVAASWAFVVSRLTLSWTVIAIAAEGFTVASIETYKTFFFPNKPRGKFAGKPILHPEYLEIRKRFVSLYAGIWALVIAHGIWALTRSM